MKNIKTKLLNKIIAVTALLSFSLLVGSVSHADGISGVCTASNVNYRTGADISYTKAGKLQTNDTINIVETNNNWYKFNLNNDYFFVSKDYIATTNNAYINSDNINVRATASTDSDIIGTLNKDDQIKVLSQNGNWYKIDYKGQAEWIFGDYVVVVNKNFGDESNNASAQAISAFEATINADCVNLRKDANTDCAIITRLAKNTSITVVGKSGDWYNVNVNGNNGWVLSTYISSVLSSTYSENTAVEATAQTKDSTITSYAKNFLGTKYVWGGNSLTSGVDCSGFTKQVMAKFNINLPRTARDQATSGTFVEKSNLKPGDLVFFDTLHKGYITHVGMYIGNGNFIHASSSSKHNGVTITDLSDYSDVYKTARRVI